jgi:DNA-binding response OmpR family regulator
VKHGRTTGNPSPPMKRRVTHPATRVNGRIWHGSAICSGGNFSRQQHSLRRSSFLHSGQMPEPIRLLFVDDDSQLRDMWRTILSGEGFHVFTAASVADALNLITREKFDVLVSDLNIGSPGDGFTIVSAMRRVQPRVVTFILTGYPAFQAALRTIHEQVDDFLTKPADPEAVIARIRQNLDRPRKQTAPLTQRLQQIIIQNREGLIEDWFHAVESDAELKEVVMTREDRIDHLPDVLAEIVRPRMSGLGIEPASRSSAAKHGKKRRTQGYTPAMLLEEARILHRVIANCTQNNLLAVDISLILPDLIDVGDKLHLMSKHSLQAFLHPDLVKDSP